MKHRTPQIQAIIGKIFEDAEAAATKNYTHQLDYNGVCLHWKLVVLYLSQRVLYGFKSALWNKDCVVRESNPGHLLGRQIS